MKQEEALIKDVSAQYDYYEVINYHDAILTVYCLLFQLQTILE